MPLRVTAIVLLLLALPGCSKPQPAPVAPSPSASPSAAPSLESPPSPSPSPSPSASPRPPFPSALKGQDLTRIATSQKIVALTFDAGANGDAVAPILATLKQTGIIATFFLTGDFVDKFPAEAKAIAAAGHRLANHTQTHPHLPALSDADVRAQIVDAENRIRAVTGKDPQPLFRFPYGDRNAHTIALVNSQGYVAVRWTVDSLGWQGTSKHTAASVAARVVAAAQPGTIAMMHVGSNPDDRSILDADALPAIINGYQSKGYSFVTLDVLLA